MAESTPEDNRARAGLLPWAAGLLAFLIRVPDLRWGLPGLEEEAHPVRKAFEMWGWDTGRLTLDPQTAGWPSLSFYVQLLLQHAQYVIGRMTGQYADRLDFFVQHVDPATLLVPARTVSLAAGVGVVVVGTRLAQRLAGTFAALVVGLVLAASPLLIEYSVNVAPDILLTLFSALALVRILDIREHGRWRDYVWAAVWIGLGAASKYTPVLLVPCLVGAHLARRGGDDGWRSVLDRRLLVAGGVCAATFFVVSPFTILNLAAAQRDVAAQLAHVTEGHFGHELRGGGFLYYLTNALPKALGWPALVLGLAGLALTAWRQRGTWWLVLLSFVVYYAGLGALRSLHPHYILPATLPVVLGLAALADEYSRTAWAERRRTTVALAAGLFLVVLLPVGARSVHQREQYARPSTLQEARRLILEKLAGPDATFACELGGPVLPRDPADELSQRPVFARLDPQQRAELLARPFVNVWPIPLYMTDAHGADLYYDLRHYLDYDYVVVTGSAYNRYRKLGESFPRQNTFYADLEEYCVLVRHFPKSAERRGPGVWIWRIGPTTSRIVEDRGPVAPGFHTAYLRGIRPDDLFSFLAFTGRVAKRREDWARADLYLGTLYDVLPANARQPLLLTLAEVKYEAGLLGQAESLCVEVLRARPHDRRALDLRAAIARKAASVESR